MDINDWELKQYNIQPPTNIPSFKMNANYAMCSDKMVQQLIHQWEWK